MFAKNPQIYDTKFCNACGTGCELTTSQNTLYNEELKQWKYASTETAAATDCRYLDYDPARTLFTTHIQHFINCSQTSCVSNAARSSTSIGPASESRAPKLAHCGLGLLLHHAGKRQFRVPTRMRCRRTSMHTGVDNRAPDPVVHVVSQGNSQMQAKAGQTNAGEARQQARNIEVLERGDDPI